MKPFVVGIAGGSASGKTKFSSDVVSYAPSGMVSVVYVDSYYKTSDHLSLEERSKQNYDHPDALEFPFIVSHLKDLIGGKTVDCPVYNFVEHTRSKEITRVEPAPLILVEGILSYYDPALQDLMNYKIFIETPTDLRLERRLARDVKERGRSPESVIKQWNTTVEPMFKKYCEPLKTLADTIIDGSNINNELIARFVDFVLPSWA